MSTVSKGQSSERKEYGSSIFVKNVSHFTTGAALKHYFASFGEVKNVDFIHTVHGDHTRSAEVKMATKESVEKIISSSESHKIDECVIQVQRFRGVENHLKDFVQGKYQVLVEGLFAPGSFEEVHRDENELKAFTALKKIDKAFQPFEYTKIEAIYHKVHKHFYDGSATVIFKDAENKANILATAKEHFPGCRITGKKIDE